MKKNPSGTWVRIGAQTILVATMLLAILVAIQHLSRHEEVTGNHADRPEAREESYEIADIATWQTAGRHDSNHVKSPFRFTMMTEESGVDFTYYGSPSPQAYMTEQNGGGIALADFDNDGWCDVFFVNGSHFDKPAQDVGASNKLYRAGENFRYVDVTRAAGLEAFGFGMGCSAADYDNDGFTDLFVAYYGRNRLWRNNGDGTFDEVTEFAGVGDDLWGTSCVFADLDADGLLDLYVANYVEWSQDDPPCHPPDSQEMRISCEPMTRTGQPDRLYRNLGNGRFEEVGAKAGIALAAEGKGLAVAVADFDKDHRLDIYVANDTTRNFLFRNLGEMRFEEVGILMGVAVSNTGKHGASMGVACADFDRNGHLDLCVTNFRNQVNDVFANLGAQGFVPRNTNLGVDLVSRSPLAFGIILADFDSDGWPDLFVANGHIWDLTSLGEHFDYEMRPQLLHNQQGKQFLDVSTDAGEYFRKRWLGRAAAHGDLDNDGDPDLVVAHIEKPPALLRNDSKAAGGSLRLTLIGTKSARQPLGARVEVLVAGELTVLHVPAGGSFQAAHDPTLLVPTHDASSLDEVRVWWPAGQVETWHNVSAANGPVRLIEGTGGLVKAPRNAQ